MASYEESSLAERQRYDNTLREAERMGSLAAMQEEQRRRRMMELQSDPNVQSFLARERELKEQQQAFQRNPKLQEQFMLEREKARLRSQGAGEGRPVSVMGPDGKSVYVSPKDAIGRTPASTSIAGSATFSPQSLEFTAKQYLAGDRQAVQGFARNAT